MADENKWEQFEGPDKNYWLEDKGRAAIFHIPLTKLTQWIERETVEDRINRFLGTTFAAGTFFEEKRVGFWKGPSGQFVYDKCRQYDVSFPGKEQIVLLLSELSEISRLIGEDCIYFKAGQYSCLIHPR